MKTIQCAHPPHHHNGFVATCRLWMARAIAIVVMRRMDALDCLHDVTIYVLCSLLCACWTLCVSWTNFCFNLYIYIYIYIYIYHVLVDRVVWCNPLIFFNPLIVWNNPFEVNVSLTEKPAGWFARAGTENCSRLNF